MDEAVDPLRAQALDLASVCFALHARRTANLVSRVYGQALADLGLEITQLSTLLLIANAGGEPMARAADILGVDRSTLARNLAVMARKGFVERGAGGCAGYRLTEEGRAVATKALPRWRAVQTSIEEEVARLRAPDPRPSLRALRQAARRLARSAAE